MLKKISSVTKFNYFLAFGIDCDAFLIIFGSPYFVPILYVVTHINYVTAHSIQTSRVFLPSDLSASRPEYCKYFVDFSEEFEVPSTQ